MSSVTIGALVLVVLAAVLTRIGERVIDWLIPRELNYRIAAGAARLATRLAWSEAEHQEARDALANILASSADSREISPLATVAPVFLRCLIGQLHWHRAALGYRHTNSKGVTYYLNTKNVTLTGGKRQTIYFFSKRWRAETACDLPGDRLVNENPRNGFLLLARKELWSDPPSGDRTQPSPTGERSLLSLRQALRSARSFPLSEDALASVIDLDRDRLFARAREIGLGRIDRRRRSGRLSAMTGEVAEAIAQLVLADLGYVSFWQITRPGIHGVDLLFLGPDDSVLALEVKGTLRRGRIPHLTTSSLQQMSREWLNSAANPAMIEWGLDADDLYAGVMVVDLATSAFRLALSGNFESYVPVLHLEQLSSLHALNNTVDS